MQITRFKCANQFKQDFWSIMINNGYYQYQILDILFYIYIFIREITQFMQ